MSSERWWRAGCRRSRYEEPRVCQNRLMIQLHDTPVTIMNTFRSIPAPRTAPCAFRSCSAVLEGSSTVRMRFRIGDDLFFIFGLRTGDDFFLILRLLVRED